MIDGGGHVGRGQRTFPPMADAPGPDERWWLDAHLDLAYLHLHGTPVHEELPDRAARGVSLPALGRGRVRVFLGTIFTELGAEAAAWSALAFLPWNWPRPRLFLGDSGAYALGLLVGAHSLPWANHQLAAVAVQCADFVQVVVARLVLGVPPWVGDRRHLTHVVQNLGLPRIAVAPLFAAIAAALAFGAR